MDLCCMHSRLSRSWRWALTLVLLSCARRAGDGGVGLRCVTAKVITRSDAPATTPTYAQYLNYTVAELQTATSNKARHYLFVASRARLV